MNRHALSTRTILLSLLCAAACGDDSEDSTAKVSEDSGIQEALDPQTPPANKAEMVRWLAAFDTEGWDAQWVCEPMPTAKTEGASAIHVHNDANGKNRVCSNRVLSEAAAGANAPKGSASIKQVGSDTYVTVKVKADSGSGEGWYFRAPGSEGEGLGLAGCTSCHALAASDAQHPGFGDYVYFQVRK